MTKVNLGRVGLYPKGTYNSEVTYEKMDVVFYPTTGSSYVSIADNNSAVPTDTTKWQPVADVSNEVAAADAAAIRANAAAEAAEELSDEFNDLKSQFEDFPSGSYPDMTVGGVMSVDGGAEDQAPYTFRASGGGVAVGNREIETLVGGTVAWNQLYQTHTDYIGSTGFSESGLTATVTDGYVNVTGTSSAQDAVQITVSPTLVVPANHVYLMLCDGWNGFAWARAGFAVKTQSYYMYKHTVQFGGAARIYFYPGETYNIHARFSGYDLTQMFGTTIADYIYSLETATRGAGVQWFKRLFGADYYQFDSGSLKSVEGVSAHVMRDADENIIGNYPLDSTLTLRGIPRLDSANRLYYDGDTYGSDGTVTIRYKQDSFTACYAVNYHTSSGLYYCTFQLSPVGINGTRSFIINAEGIVPTTTSAVIGTAYITNTGSLLAVIFPDQTITTKADADAYLAQHPVSIVYELATPTTETATPYTNPQIVDNLGTEEYVTTGIVPVGHSTIYPTDIVAKVDGLPSDFSTLIAPTETGFKATRAYSVNQFLIISNQLYKVTASISSGATITPETNVTAVTVANILTALLNA